MESIENLTKLGNSTIEKMITKRMKLKEQEMSGIRQSGDTASAIKKTKDKIARRYKRARDAIYCNGTRAIPICLKGKRMTFGIKHARQYQHCPTCGSLHEYFSKNETAFGSVFTWEVITPVNACVLTGTAVLFSKAAPSPASIVEMPLELLLLAFPAA